MGEKSANKNKYFLSKDFIIFVLLSSVEGTERVIKRRKVVLDETHLQIPLNHGWKRQTHINNYGRRGIQGEVCYFAPCGRKMKTIPDVMRVRFFCTITESFYLRVSKLLIIAIFID